MEELSRLDPIISCSRDTVRVDNLSSNVTAASTSNEFHNPHDSLVQFEADDHLHHPQVTGSDMHDLIKTQIGNHPRYPALVSAYIECQKVGAPPEMTSILEEIGKEAYPIATSCEIGADPELDEFMESYCEILHRYKEELSKPFNEATMFLSSIESRLSNLCKGEFTKTLDYGSDEAAGTSEGEALGSIEEASDGQAHNQDLKLMLMRKYSGYLGNLKKEFLKKRKKEKLPNGARLTLLDWWSNHYKWPYPTEEEKVKLSEMTGLEQKQVNNWFINQRKRHWKPSPSQDMRSSTLMHGHL